MSPPPTHCAVPMPRARPRASGSITRGHAERRPVRRHPSDTTRGRAHLRGASSRCTAPCGRPARRSAGARTTASSGNTPAGSGMVEPLVPVPAERPPGCRRSRTRAEGPDVGCGRGGHGRQVETAPAPGPLPGASAAPFQCRTRGSSWVFPCPARAGQPGRPGIARAERGHVSNKVADLGRQTGSTTRQPCRGRYPTRRAGQRGRTPGRPRPVRIGSPGRDRRPRPSGGIPARCLLPESDVHQAAASLCSGRPARGVHWRGQNVRRVGCTPAPGPAAAPMSRHYAKLGGMDHGPGYEFCP